MPELASPFWLLALPPVTLAIWWLHRLRQSTAPVAVAALFLWDGAARRSGQGLSLERQADPAWWLRAAIAALLILALAAPYWRTGAGPLVVWVDDSLSMQAAAGTGTRENLGVNRLLEALASTRHASVELRALGHPDAALALSANSAKRRGEIDDWLGALTPAEPDYPPPVELDAAATHWLVTDAADPGLAAWLAAAPIARVFDVGAPAANAAVTRLALRLSPAADHWSGLIEVGGTGPTTATRRLALRADGVERQSWSLTLEPGAPTQVSFELPDQPGQIEAVIDGGDALAADDSLALAVPPLERPIAVRGTCGPALSGVLAAHPRLALNAPDPILLVVCGDERSPGTLPTLRIHSGDALPAPAAQIPAWTAAAGDLANLFLDGSWLTPVASPLPTGEPWLYVGSRPAVVLEPGREPTLHVLLDLEDPTFTATPEFPVFVARLLTKLDPDLALDPIPTASRPLAASDLTPQVTARVSDTVVSDTLVSDTPPGGLNLQRPLLAAALILLLAEMLLVVHRSHRRPDARRLGAPLGTRAAIALTLLIALLRPTWLDGSDPRDLLVIWDDSASVADATKGPAWAELAGLARTLPHGSRLSLVRFAADTAIEPNRSETALTALADGSAPASAQALDTGDSDLAAALAAGLRLVDPARPTTLALFTDGHVDRATAAEWLTRAGASGLPVYSLGRAVDPDVRLKVHAPTDAPAGRTVPIDVTVTSDIDRSGVLGLVVDGKLAAQTNLDLLAALPMAARFELVAPPGTRELDVQWRDGTGAITRRNVLEVNGPAPWLALSTAPDGAALAALRAAGWSVTGIEPDNFPAYADRLGEFAGIVLDDVAIADLPASAWSRLSREVTERGKSLLVLGGPRSFGVGGYRRSALEQVLPVTAEARNPRASSAALFVLDVSGSMGRSLTEADPMAYARRAVVETAKSLGAGDEVGLIAFDVEARNALPLGRYPDPAAALESTFASLGPAGGTRIRPALTAALTELSATDKPRRLLILVTDGFIENEEIESQLEAIQARGIDLIVFAVGRDADRVALRALADGDHLFRVDRVSELPDLMRTQVERRRRPLELGDTAVRRVNPLPGDPALESLPAVSGYLLTMAKPAATVYFETATGDPLVAAAYAGAGRVVALPAGLGAWAERWTASSDWPGLGAALAGWLGDDAGGGYSSLAVEDSGAELAATVDALEPDGSWSEDPAVPVVVVDPLEASQRYALPRVAPGRFAGRIDSALDGNYLVSAQPGAHGVRRAHFRSEQRELDSLLTPSLLKDWLDAGLVAAPPQRSADWRFSRASQARRLGAGWLAIVVLAFLGVLAWPHRRAFASGLERFLPERKPR